MPTPPDVGDGTLVRDFAYSTTLDTVIFQLRLAWNSRANQWGLSVSDAGGNVIVEGIALRLGVDILSPFRGYAIPAGTFDVVDTSLEGAEAERDELGKRVLFQYVEAN